MWITSQFRNDAYRSVFTHGVKLFIEPGKFDMANQSSFDRGHKSDYPVNSVVMLHSVSNAAFLMHRKAFGESPLYIARGLRFVVSILVSETVSPSYNTMCHMI